MKACILAIGSEMLTPFRVDTNSLFITERLNAIGYDVRLKAVVGDDVDELARVVESALAWADLIVVTGGLGPTEDDMTRDAVARVLGIAARRRRGDRRAHPRALRAARHDDAGDQPPAGDGAARRRRCCRIRTARRRACGSSTDATAIVLLPGPPREMKPMLEAVIAERLAPKSRRRRPVPARAEDHRPRRVGRRRAGVSRSTASGRRRRCRSARRSSRSSVRSSCTSRRRPRSQADADAALDAAVQRAAGRRSARRSTASTAARSKRSSAICCASAR